MAKRKPTTYNLILKQFTKLNNKLPEENKLSLKLRREIIKKVILPKYKGVPQYKIKIKPLRNLIIGEIEKVPPKEICDLNYIDPSEFAFVEWYALDETISELVPDCVFVKVTAGDYGETNIFNTRNYEYGRNGVRSIVEEIRPDADNSSGKFVFSGYKKLRPRKKNDGTPENYYLDFVLFLIDKKGNEKPQGNTESVKFDVPKTRENRTKKTQVKNIIEDRIKRLKTKKDSKRRAKKTLEKNIKEFTVVAKRLAKAKKPNINTVNAFNKRFIKAAELLEKYYAQGKLTKLQYEKNLEKITKEFGS
jgi:antitoxin component HigA of HigAB toxin-antitoxin module